jgi:subtilase family serine protease
MGAATGPVRVRVYLAPRGGLKALKGAAVAVSTPGNRRYRRFLTPKQFRARYEPTLSSEKAVERFLRGAGMTIVSVEGRRRWVVARGSAEAADRAFGTRLARFARRGRVVRAPASPVTVPADVRADILSVSGLDSLRHTVRPTVTLPPPEAATILAGYHPARPCSRYYGQLSARFEADGTTALPVFGRESLSYGICGYTPRQLRSAYEGRTSLTGKGVTVAVVDAFASGTMRADANRYAKRHGDRPFARGQYSERLPRSFKLNGPASCGEPAGWAVEETLDVEAIHAMAPGANVRYYGTRKCDDPIDPGTIAALDAIVDENRASIVSNSYGDVEASFTPSVRAGYEQAFLQAAMQGIGIFYSSGDFGAVMSYPQSDPFVTSVGGTSAAIGARGKLLFQTGWATDAYTLSADRSGWRRSGPAGAAGGGLSNVFDRPSWQKGVVPAASPARRAVPDIAMDADPSTGMAVGETQEFPDGVRYAEIRIGGTSLAAPLMAGVQALASQAAGGRLGLATPAIYRLARRGVKAYTDIVPKYDGRAAIRPDFVNGLNSSGGITYGLRSFGDSAGFGARLTTARGWDYVTGVGTPNSRYLRRQGR